MRIGMQVLLVAIIGADSAPDVVCHEVSFTARDYPTCADIFAVGLPDIRVECEQCPVLDMVSDPSVRLRNILQDQTAKGIFKSKALT
jgi:hypothetical protein